MVVKKLIIKEHLFCHRPKFKNRAPCAIPEWVSLYILLTLYVYTDMIYFSLTIVNSFWFFWLSYVNYYINIRKVIFSIGKFLMEDNEWENHKSMNKSSLCY